MEPNTLLAHLRLLMAEPPSSRVWEMLCALLCAPMSATTRRVAIEYADAHLERWPDALRVASAGTDAPMPAAVWLLRALRGEPAPELRLVRSVRLDGLSVPKDAYTRLCSALAEAKPTELVFNACDVPRHIEYILNHAAWTRLERLTLRACQFDAVNGFYGRFDLNCADTLTHLDLTGNAFDTRVMANIRSGVGPALHALHALNLTHCALDAKCLETLYGRFFHTRIKHLNVSHNNLQGGHEALARVLDCEALESLDISHCGLTFSTLAHLKRSPQRARPRELHIAGNAIGPRGLRALTDLAVMQRVEVLGLSQCGLDGEALGALSDAPNLDRLTHLDASSNHVAPSALDTLDRALKMLVSLHTLALRDAGLDDAGLDALAELDLPALRRLDLAETTTGAGGSGCLRLDSLAEADLALEHLDLGGHALTHGAIQALLRAPWTETLCDVGLVRVGAGDQLARLVEVPWPKLTALRLDHCGLTDTTIKTLATDLRAPALTELTLNGNAFSHDGHAALAASHLVERLERLELSDARLNDACLSAYQDARALRLRVLTLNRNRFRTLTPIAHNGHLRALDRLEINWNNVNDAQLFSVFQAPHLSLAARARLLDQAATSTLAAFARRLKLPLEAAQHPAPTPTRTRRPVVYEPGAPGAEGLTQEELLEILGTSGVLDRTHSGSPGAETPRFDLPIGIALAHADDPDPLRSVFDEPEEPGPDARAALLEAICLALARRTALDASNADLLRAPPEPS